MNRSKLLAIAAIAATVIFTSHKASAVMGVVNISGTITFEADTTTDDTAETMKTVKKSFKNADALALLANATGQSWFTNKNSKLVYDPDAFDGTVFGVFWVTNTTTHQGFQLSQSGDGYFSYIELDFTPWELGFSDGYFDLNGIFSGKYVATPYSYSDKIMGNATLYIHSNPGAYDYVDDPSVAGEDNDFAVVITGTISYSYSYKSSSIPGFFNSKNSFSLKGSGDVFWYDDSLPYLQQAVFTGSAKYSGSGLEEFDDSPPAPGF